MHFTHSTLTAFASAALAAAAFGQTVYTIDGSFASILEQTGPSGLCGYPSGPHVSSFPGSKLYTCPTIVPFGPPPGLAGDVAIDRVFDVVYATDGTRITAYTTGGVVLKSFTLAAALPTFGTITGLGYDAVGSLLWISNATSAAAIIPPSPGDCISAIVVVPPFALPTAIGAYTDIDWDPSTGTVFACTTLGAVANAKVGGGLGPFGIFVPVVSCVSAPYYGIALDHAAGAPWTMYLSDGVMIERVAFGGTTPTFYSPANCSVAVAGTTSGLAFAARGITYGVAYPPTTPVILSAQGQSVTPNPNFAFNMVGAPAGSFALVYYSLGYSCPAFPLGLNSVYILTPFLLKQGIVPLSGVFTAAAPLPANLPIPVSLFVQGFVVVGSTLLNTNGTEISIARP